MRAEYLKNYISEIDNFPTPGVKFKDLSPLFLYKLDEVATLLSCLFVRKNFDFIAGIDARGFIIAAAMAIRAEKHFLTIRKKGKLPPPYAEVEYSSEYGTSTLVMTQIPASVFTGKVLIVDDVLATGGTLKAAADLCNKAGYSVAGFAAVADLQYLNQFEWNGMKCESLVQYES
jgi:adenine phosphoribosyltransferase